MLELDEDKPKILEYAEADAHEIVEALARLYLDYGLDFDQACRITYELLLAEFAKPSLKQRLNFLGPSWRPETMRGGERTVFLGPGLKHHFGSP